MTRPVTALAWSPGAAGPLLTEADRWWHAAACLGADTGMFFAHPEKAPDLTAEAKAYCARCPVLDECLRDALKTGDTDGVRGGMTGPERRAFRAGMPSVPLCSKRLHVMNEENTSARGDCKACRRAAGARLRREKRIARTGDPTPRSGKRLAA